MMSWYLYIIKTKKNKLYTGITRNVERRFLEHLSGIKGAKFFRSDEAEQIVYLETFLNRSEASIRESEVKKLSRNQKNNLVDWYEKLNS